MSNFAPRTTLAAFDLEVRAQARRLLDRVRIEARDAEMIAGQEELAGLRAYIHGCGGCASDFRGMTQQEVEAAGGKIEDTVKITLLIKNHDEKKLRYLVTKRRDVFGDRPPASTLIPVPALALESLEFEIDAIVVTPNQ